MPINRCSSCLEQCLPTDLCNSCHYCTINGCCRCRKCPVNGCEVRSSNSHVICSTCECCINHCRCYVCSTCDVRLEGAQRNYNYWCNRCGNCNAHCRCYSCRQGIIYNGDCTHVGSRTSVCINCARCSVHCTCSRCDVCERLFGSVHSCGACERCCSCNVTGVRLREGKLLFHNSVFGNGEFKVNKLRRHLSTELEVDIFNYDKSSTVVSRAINSYRDPVMRDGSIGEDGFEILTNPSNGDKFLKHIKDITSGLELINGGCSESCGLHVHVNVNGDLILDKQGNVVYDVLTGKPQFDRSTAYSQYDLRRLINLYYKVEPAMFALCSDVRLTSRYSAICGPYWKNVDQDFKKFRKNLLSTMYLEGRRDIHNNDVIKDSHGSFSNFGQSIKYKKSHKYEKCRYNALNIHSYFMRGTIEFRHHQGSVDYQTITNWAIICGYIVESASRMTDIQIESLSNNPFDALVNILPENLHEYCHDKWHSYFNTSWTRFLAVFKTKFERYDLTLNTETKKGG